MLVNFTLKNLVVESENHTDLLSTTDEVARIRKSLLPKLSSIGKSFDKCKNKTAVVTVRIGNGCFLTIYANKKCEDNPRIFCYDNISGKLSESIPFEKIKNLTNEKVLFAVCKALDGFENKDMSNFFPKEIVKQMEQSAIGEQRDEKLYRYNLDIKKRPVSARELIESGKCNRVFGMAGNMGKWLQKGVQSKEESQFRSDEELEPLLC